MGLPKILPSIRRSVWQSKRPVAAGAKSADQLAFLEPNIERGPHRLRETRLCGTPWARQRRAWRAFRTRCSQNRCQLPMAPDADDKWHAIATPFLASGRATHDTASIKLAARCHG